MMEFYVLQVRMLKRLMFQKKLCIEFPNGTAVPIFGIHQKILKTGSQAIIFYTNVHSSTVYHTQKMKTT